MITFDNRNKTAKLATNISTLKLFIYSLSLSFFVFQGRLNELMSQLRMQTQVPAAKADSRFSLDPILLDEIRQVSERSVCV